MNRIASLSLSLAAVSVLVLASAACESESKPPPAAPAAPVAETTETTTTAGTPPATTAFTVGDTFGALRAIHAAEIDHGMLAQKKATDPKVKAFAEKVVNDHNARMQKDNKLMSALGIAPRDTAVSEQITSASQQQSDRLNALSGADFDRAYIEEQIEYYRKALDAFDRDILPNVRDPQIRANVTEARVRANEHLKEAQDLRLSLVKPR